MSNFVGGITPKKWTSVSCNASAVAISSNWKIWIEIACPLKNQIIKRSVLKLHVGLHWK